MEYQDEVRRSRQQMPLSGIEGRLFYLALYDQ